MFFGASVQRALWSACTCENVACGKCTCLHLPSISQGTHFPASKKKKEGISELRNHYCSLQMRIAKNSNFCLTSNHLVAPTDFTRTNVLDSTTCFSVTSKDRFSILHRFDNYILEVLQIGGPFVVLIVVQDEWVCFLLKSLSHVHHAVFSFLVGFNEIRSLIHWCICPQQQARCRHDNTVNDHRTNGALNDRPSDAIRVRMKR